MDSRPRQVYSGSIPTNGGIHGVAIIITLVTFVSVCSAQDNWGLQIIYYNRNVRAALDRLDTLRELEHYYRSLPTNTSREQKACGKLYSALCGEWNTAYDAWGSKNEQIVSVTGSLPESFRESMDLVDSAYLCFGRYVLATSIQLDGLPDILGVVPDRYESYDKSQAFEFRARQKTQ
jgi:hypothetical protein